MAEKVFLIGIGGTGMRCLEAFVHTCAMGMFDKTEVHMLALDTDEHNGNFERLRALQNCYRKLNGGKVRDNTFFSADIHYYEFCPAYTGQTFARQTHYGNNDKNGKKSLSDELVDLFMSPDVLYMNLEHGYRAQTQMGSVLMYYAIQKATYEAKKGNRHQDFKEFLHQVCGDARFPVFVFGSVFGGTGASSIPIIPLALDRAAKILDSNPVTVNNDFGTIVLTNYFNFKTPQVKPGEVVAKSDNFAINSQAALMFYNEDNTVNNVYKRMYLLGRGSASLRDVTSGNGSKSATGGKDQENPSDYIELLAALAAYDFVKEFDKKTDAFKEEDKRFFCIGHNYGDGKLEFPLFAQRDADVLQKKFGVLTAASVLSLPIYDFFRNVTNDAASFPNVDVDGEEMKALKDYFSLFNYGLDDKDRLVGGWLPQMYASRKAGILFNTKLFEQKTLKEMRDFKLDSELFYGENPPKFTLRLGISRVNRIFEAVKNCFNRTLTERDSNMADLLARTYATLVKLYFNE